MRKVVENNFPNYGLVVKWRKKGPGKLDSNRGPAKESGGFYEKGSKF